MPVSYEISVPKEMQTMVQLLIEPSDSRYGLGLNLTDARLLAVELDRFLKIKRAFPDDGRISASKRVHKAWHVFMYSPVFYAQYCNNDIIDHQCDQHKDGYLERIQHTKAIYRNTFKREPSDHFWI
jgi:hypothetical protein